MNTPNLPNHMVQAPSLAGPNEGYMPGFGNDFETEALPGALPQGMNSPQKCNYGLYGEQLSGTAFTADPPERTWCYRIRPSVKHSARYARIDVPYWKSAPHVLDDVISLGQYRWDPVPHTDEALTWVTGMRTVTTAGDVNTQVGMASHIYLVTESMVDDYFRKASCAFRPNWASSTWSRRKLPSSRAGLSTGLRCWKARRAALSARTTARNTNCRAAARSAPTAWPTRATSRRRWRLMRTAMRLRP